MDKKYLCQTAGEELAIGYGHLNEIIIDKVGGTKEIAGFLCQRAKAVCPDISDEPFYIYYTDEIKIKDPNSNSPYKGLDGVLLEFEVILNKVIMKFSAAEVKPEKVDWSNFEIPKGYSEISREQMEEIIQKFQKVSDI